MAEFFFNKTNPYDVSKIYVMRLVKLIFLPLEKSYYFLNDLILLKLAELGAVEEMPELKIHRGIRDVDQLFQILGYEDPSIDLRNSLHKYKFKSHKMNRSNDSVRNNRSPKEKHKKSKFYKLQSKLPPVEIPMPGMFNLQKVVDDATPVAPEDSAKIKAPLESQDYSA